VNSSDVRDATGQDARSPRKWRAGRRRAGWETGARPGGRGCSLRGTGGQHRVPVGGITASRGRHWGKGAGATEVAAAAHQRGAGGREGGRGVDHDVAFAELAGQGQVGCLDLKRRAFAQVALPGGLEGEGDVGCRRDPANQRRGEVGGAVVLARGDLGRDNEDAPGVFDGDAVAGLCPAPVEEVPMPLANPEPTAEL
jgi:hypothetical protein